jgi:hypothetical protein
LQGLSLYLLLDRGFTDLDNNSALAHDDMAGIEVKLQIVRADANLIKLSADYF